MGKIVGIDLGTTKRELSGRVPEGDRARIEQQIKAVKDAMQGNDIQRIRNAVETLQQASYALGQQLYQTQQGQPGSNGRVNGQGDSQGEDVVEGEFREA